MNKLLAIGLMALTPQIAAAETPTQHATSPYAGEESRAIKSLSAEDIAELQRGGGWGLARPAELNGVPGPTHLLELKDAIPLSPEQVVAIQAAYERMRAAAITEGEILIARERALDEAFRTRNVTEKSLHAMLAAIEESRASLRYIHLAAHLATPHLLSEEQIVRYNALRGYGEDPCARVPDGHDAAMWRKHNACE